MRVNMQNNLQKSSEVLSVFVKTNQLLNPIRNYKCYIYIYNFFRI
jgi:hypothetical protein